MKDYLMRFIGTPYVWGGENQETGLDCSGLVLLGLKAWGVVPYMLDSTAQGIYNLLNAEYGHGVLSNIKENNILFFGKDLSRITHVTVAINDWQMIEAGGEGSMATKKGFVRIAPIGNRKDLIANLEIFQ